MGTWRSHIAAPETSFVRVPNDIPLLAAATIAVNPCTALRMLTDYVPLKAGWWIDIHACMQI
jgi:trans-2-enoyl-CoA reductase